MNFSDRVNLLFEKKWFWPLVCALLAAGLYLPSLGHPPRSDFWPAVYFFQRMDALGGFWKWPSLLLYDPLINVTFRPLSFLLPYFEFRLFGSAYVFYNVCNLAVFFVDLVLLWFLALRLTSRPALAGAAVALFASLFTHFDLVCWAFHVHILTSFALLLGSFLLFLRWIETGRRLFLLSVAPLMLTGMLMYESFVLWPWALFLLPAPAVVARPRRIAALAVIVLVYAGYWGLFFADRALRGESMDLLPLGSMLAPANVLLSLCAVCFNWAYNNFLLWFIPWLGLPLSFDENLCLGGWVFENTASIVTYAWVGGGAVAAGLGFLFWRFGRRLSAQDRGWLLFLGFLCFSQLFVLFHSKLLVNSYPYNFLQFRYQYIPNAFIVLVLVLICDRFVVTSRRAAAIIYLSVLLAAGANVHAVREGRAVLESQLAPLSALLGSIGDGIARGRISPERPLHLSERVAASLPQLCWNRDMGRRCMQGTYEWIFPARLLPCFASEDRAVWTINAETLALEPIKKDNP